MLAVVCAMRQELRPIMAKMNVSGRHNVDGAMFYHADLNGLPLTLVQSGIGRNNAIKATNYLLNTLKINLLITSGVAGGLRQGVNVGDLVISENVGYSKQSDFEGEGLSLESNYSCKEEYIQIARRLCSDLEMKHHFGNLLTVDKVISQAKTKKKIGEENAFLAVDMESAAVAEVAHERGIGFMAVRSISDDIEDNLQLDYDGIVSDEGKVRVSNIALQVMRSPQKLTHLKRLNKQTKTAAKNLSVFMLQFIPAIYDKMFD